MLSSGARWAVKHGWGRREDLERVEEQGCMAGAQPDQVSLQARKRQRNEMGTLGSGNHYLEVQEVSDIHDPDTATTFGLARGDVVISIHCGSRGLGHQIGTEFLRSMAITAGRHGIRLPDRELACAPIESNTGRSYLGAMRAAINCALANRQIITHLTREVFERIVPEANLELLYDVSHNTCKEEEHVVEVDRAGVAHRLLIATVAHGGQVLLVLLRLSGRLRRRHRTTFPPADQREQLLRAERRIGHANVSQDAASDRHLVGPVADCESRGQSQLLVHQPQGRDSNVGCP